MVKDLAARFVISADPMQNEKLWENMFRGSVWGLGGGPVVYGGMSAIDEALWDIKGKALNVPVYVPSAARSTPNSGPMPVNCSSVGRTNTDPKPAVKPEEYAEEALRAVSQGHTAIKWTP